MWFRRKLVPFIDRAPTKGGGMAKLRVTRMTVPHVQWWHGHVQPIIDRDKTRADNGWNWLLYVPIAHIAGTVLHKQPYGYTVGLIDEERDRLIPIALVQILGRHPDLDEHRKTSAFVWFMSTAPDEALRTLEPDPLSKEELPRRVGTIALDVAVTHSFNHRRKGRTGLYADEAGGDALLAWYRKRGMAVLPADRRLPPTVRRLVKPSDGRYCYYTTNTARAANEALQALRGAR